MSPIRGNRGRETWNSDCLDSTLAMLFQKIVVTQSGYINFYISSFFICKIIIIDKGQTVFVHSVFVRTEKTKAITRVQRIQ